MFFLSDDRTYIPLSPDTFVKKKWTEWATTEWLTYDKIFRNRYRSLCRVERSILGSWLYQEMFFEGSLCGDTVSVMIRHGIDDIISMKFGHPSCSYVGRNTIEEDHSMF